MEASAGKSQQIEYCYRISKGVIIGAETISDKEYLDQFESDRERCMSCWRGVPKLISATSIKLHEQVQKEHYTTNQMVLNLVTIASNFLQYDFTVVCSYAQGAYLKKF